MAKRVELEVKRKIAHTFILTEKLPYEEIAEVTELPIEEIENLAEEKCMGLTDMERGRISEPILNQF